MEGVRYLEALAILFLAVALLAVAAALVQPSSHAPHQRYLLLYLLLESLIDRHINIGFSNSCCLSFSEGHLGIWGAPLIILDSGQSEEAGRSCLRDVLKRSRC